MSIFTTNKELYCQATLAQHPHLKPQVIKLIEGSFHYSPAFSFAIDFAPLFTHTNLHNIHILLNKSMSKALGCIGCLPQKISFKGTYLPVLFLGGICLDVDLQSKGHFTPFFNTVLSRYKNSCALFVLWSNLHELYKKFGFFLSGIQYEFPGRAQENCSLKHRNSVYSKTILTLSKNELDQIKLLYDQNPCAKVERTEKTWNTLKQITSATITFKVKDQKIIWYYIAHKGFDLHNIVHELVHAPETTLEEVLQHIPKGLNIWHQYRPTFPFTTSPIGLFKVGCTNLLNTFLKNCAQDALFKNKDSLPLAEQKIRVKTLLEGTHNSPPLLHPLLIGGVDSI